MSYMQIVKNSSILSIEDEIYLFTKFQSENCKKSAEKIVISNLRFVAHIARGYKNYKVNLDDLFQEGVIGLMKAVKSYDLSKGVRFVSYANMWIKAEILKFINKNIGIVNIITTNVHRKLFYNITRLKGKSETLTQDDINRISLELNVKKSDVIDMDIKLNNDDVSIDKELYDDNMVTIGDSLVCNRSIPYDVVISNNQELSLLESSIKILSGRELEIFTDRRLVETPIKREVLANKYKISQQRISQLELVAFNKIRNNILKFA